VEKKEKKKKGGKKGKEGKRKETVEYACWQWTNFLFRADALDKAQRWYTPGPTCSVQSQGALW